MRAVRRVPVGIGGLTAACVGAAVLLGTTTTSAAVIRLAANAARAKHPSCAQLFTRQQVEQTLGSQYVITWAGASKQTSLRDPFGIKTQGSACSYNWGPAPNGNPDAAYNWDLPLPANWEIAFDVKKKKWLAAAASEQSAVTDPGNAFEGSGGTWSYTPLQHLGAAAFLMTETGTGATPSGLPYSAVWVYTTRHNVLWISLWPATGSQVETLAQAALSHSWL